MSTYALFKVPTLGFSFLVQEKENLFRHFMNSSVWDPMPYLISARGQVLSLRHLFFIE